VIADQIKMGLFQNMEFEAGIGIILTALLWGITDPLLKKFGTGFDKTSDSNSSESSFISKFWREISFLFTNWKYVFTFCSNQVKLSRKFSVRFIYIGVNVSSSCCICLGSQMA